MILHPVIFAHYQEIELGFIEETIEASKGIEVEVSKKDIVSEIHDGYLSSHTETKKYFVFEHEAEEYYVTSDNTFFNKVKEGIKIQIFFREGKIVAVTPDGEKSILERF